MKINKAIIKIAGMIECPADFLNKAQLAGYHLQEDTAYKGGAGKEHNILQENLLSRSEKNAILG